MALLKDEGVVGMDEPLKGSLVEVVDLLSDTEEVVESALKALTPGKAEMDEQSSATEEGSSPGEYWESESLLEDAFGGMSQEYSGQRSMDACSSEECRSYVKLLRELGVDQFVRETVEARKITVKRLLTAFNARVPSFLEGQSDYAYLPLLGLAMERELQKRAKLPQYNTVEDAVALLKTSSNIIVLTGAGISTSLGIPDFRSKDTGLYAQLEYLGLSDPQEVFNIELFREDPTIFYAVAKDILPSTNKFSPTHAFIRLLQEKGKLLTNYTQNIDNLEGFAGILPEKLIQCHGSFATATCQMCKYRVKCEEIYKDLKAGQVAKCDRCVRRNIRAQPTLGMKRKRSSHGSKPRKRQDYEDSTDEEDLNDAAVGVMKPDITFFGEQLPGRFHDRIVDHDKHKVDLVIVIGTSLKVAPVGDVVGFLPAHVPQIYISRTPCSHVNFDIDLFGDCDIVVTELCKRADWDLQHEMIPPAQKINVVREEGYESRYRFAAEQFPFRELAKSAKAGIEKTEEAAKAEAPSLEARKAFDDGKLLSTGKADGSSFKTEKKLDDEKALAIGKLSEADIAGAKRVAQLDKVLKLENGFQDEKHSNPNEASL